MALPYVAVVEDDAHVRRALARLLIEVGYDVATFGSAEDFVDALGARMPACVVLDAHLPKMSGFELFNGLLRNKQCGVVFITADHEVATSDLMRRSGVACLRKPLDANVLVNAIDEAIHR